MKRCTEWFNLYISTSEKWIKINIMAFSPNIKYYVYTLHIVNINIQIVNSWVFDLTKLNLIRLKNKERSQKMIKSLNNKPMWFYVLHTQCYCFLLMRGEEVTGMTFLTDPSIASVKSMLIFEYKWRPSLQIPCFSSTCRTT